MQKTITRRILNDVIAIFRKRSNRVLAMQVVPGGLLPLMARYTVFSKPFTGQPVNGLNPRLEQFQDFLKGKSRTESKLAIGCSSNWHRESVSMLNRPTAEFVRSLACYFGIGLRSRNQSGRQLPFRNQV